MFSTKNYDKDTQGLLGRRKVMEAAINSHINDLLLDETMVSVSEVVEHLSKFGLATKHPELMEGGAVLGLKLERDRVWELVFQGDNEIPEVRKGMSRRELFCVCGRLIGHHPIEGRPMLACSYLKRRAERVRWEDKVSKETVMMM